MQRRSASSVALRRQGNSSHHQLQNYCTAAGPEEVVRRDHSRQGASSPSAPTSNSPGTDASSMTDMFLCGTRSSSKTSNGNTTRQSLGNTMGGLGNRGDSFRAASSLVCSENLGASGNFTWQLGGPAVETSSPSSTCSESVLRLLAVGARVPSECIAAYSDNASGQLSNDFSTPLSQTEGSPNNRRKRNKASVLPSALTLPSSDATKSSGDALLVSESACLIGAFAAIVAREASESRPVSPPAPAYSSEGSGHGLAGLCQLDIDKGQSSLLARRSKRAGEVGDPSLLSVVIASPGGSAGIHNRRAPKRKIKVLGPEQKIFDLYTWDEVLQEEGDGGKVVVCAPKVCTSSEDTPDKEFVMKIKSKRSLRQIGVEAQFRMSQERMLNFPPHEGVIPIYEVLENEDFFYVVMQKADGPDFFYSLVSEFTDGVMPAWAVKRIMKEILQAVSHVHKQGMLHRDIKPDNLVMQKYDDPESPTGKANKVMLVDFDHADPEWSPLSPSKQQDKDTIFGTVRFNAPETFFGTFSPESDLYSVGVILYLLMAGKMPFDDEIFYDNEAIATRRDSGKDAWRNFVYFRLKRTRIDWACSPWQDQRICKTFCSKLLAFEPTDRFSTAEEAMGDPWCADTISPAMRQLRMAREAQLGKVPASMQPSNDAVRDTLMGA